VVYFNFGRFQRRHAPKTRLVSRFLGWYGTLHWYVNVEYDVTGPSLGDLERALRRSILAVCDERKRTSQTSQASSSGAAAAPGPGPSLPLPGSAAAARAPQGLRVVPLDVLKSKVTHRVAREAGAHTRSHFRST
jgi:hypothetical protein